MNIQNNSKNTNFTQSICSKRYNRIRSFRRNTMYTGSKKA